MGSKPGPRGLTKAPLDPFMTCSLLHLSMKVAFLVTNTSAQRVSGLGALMAHPPSTVFVKDKVTLQPHPKFFPKVSSSFHLNQPIHLPTFYPNPHGTVQETVLHSLDVRHALAFYLDRMKPFRKSPRLFISTTE